MKIAVLGTGKVGRTIASRLASLEHEVMMGSRTADNDAASTWAAENGDSAAHGTFADAASSADLIFNCTSGSISIDALTAAGADNLSGKTLVDVSNPLDSSADRPGTLTVCNTTSNGEEIQAAFPDAHVVKTLNTMNGDVMVDPSLVAGEHDVFICGEDESAKAEVSELLQSFGWPPEAVIDLGGIIASRGVEMYMAFWVANRLALGHNAFNIKIVR